MPKRSGRKSVAQTPAPPKERIFGSKKNPKGSASSEKTAKSIKLSPSIVLTLSKKLKEFKEKNSNANNITLADLKAVYRRGSGAYSKSHRPTIKGGVPNTRNAWAMARVNKFLKKASGEKVKKAYVQDDDLMKMENGGAILLAPNGNPSNLTAEQYKLVRTPEFKDWFGDWETAYKTKNYEGVSKVVDAKGEPLVVYHGSRHKFYEFLKKTNYFSKSRKVSETYGRNISPFFLNIKNPFIWDANCNEYAETYGLVDQFDFALSKVADTKQEQKIFRDWGNWTITSNCDGIFIKNIVDTFATSEDLEIEDDKYDDWARKWCSDDYITIFPQQIKLADGSNITFDPTNPDIRYETGGGIEESDVKGFYNWYIEWYKGVMDDITIMFSISNELSLPEFQDEGSVILEVFSKKKENVEAKKYLSEIVAKLDEYNVKIYLDPTPTYNVVISRQVDKNYLIQYYKKFDFKLINEKNRMVRIPSQKKYENENGVLRGGYEELTDRILSKKIEKFLNSVKPFKYYFVNPDMNTLVVGFDKHYSKNSLNKVKKEAESSSDYFDADSIQSTLDPKTEDTKYIVKLKKIVEYKKGGEMKEMIALPDVYSSFEPLKRVLNMQGYDLTKSYKEGGEMKTNKIEEVVDTIGNVDSDPIVEGVMEKGGMLSDDKRETYSKWKDLINMSKSELEKFYNSEEGKEAGISVGTAKKLGISRGRTSAKWIMKMKDTPVSKWTPEMWKWANKQISFVSRMRGNKGDLYDDKGRKTRKHTSLLIWGHNPEKYKEGGETKMVSLEGYYAKGGEAKTCEVIRNGVRQIDPKSIEKLTDCVMRLPQTKQFNTNEQGEYTPERKQLHKKIIYDIKKDLTCVERKEPIAILMGGSPASGKSTFLKKYRPYLLSEEILKVDADEVRSKLPEYKGWNATQTHLETKDIVNLLLSDRNIGIPCAFDLIYDGTMNSTKSYIPLISLLKSLGYKVFIVYIDKVDEDTIKQRALKRYQKSGRFVPLEVIDDFFNKGTSALENLKSMVDGYMIVDGSTSDYKVIDRGGLQLPKDRKYSNIGRPIEVTEEEVVREYKKGGETDFNPDAKKLKNMITHKSGSAGGMLVGNRHSEGGIKAMNKSTGQPLEMEGGEVVITRDAVSDDTKREFEGKMLTNREILSKINESGGGVAFAEGGDVHECGCTGKSYNYGGKTMTDFDIVMQMKSAYPKDFAKGKEEELSEHRGTFEKLRRKGLTANKAAELVVAEHLKKKPDYYKNYKEGGVIDILGKKIPSMPTFMELGDRVITPFKEQLSYFYPIKNAVTKNVEYRDGGHIRGRKISDLLAYKTYIYDNFDINFSDLPVKLQNALTLGKQKLVDDYLKE